MSDKYNPKEVEPKWQAYWDAHQTFRTSDDASKPKAYVLDMFPYPSGAGLHVGHPEGYTATDIYARYLRSKGYAVLHPMGWDAFGLPAEQYAIQTGTHPRVTTAQNIATFKRQIKALGLSYDWEREVDTTDPEYVKWTQWIFLRMFKRGLAYQEEVAVNWCAALGTVLANEEVKDGKSERGGHPVERMPLRQWMLRITAYADRLLDELKLADWPDGTRIMQEEWIGRSEGAEVRFAVKGHRDLSIEVFTTRPDTLYGVTYMALSPEHALIEKLVSAECKARVSRYVEATKNRSDLERKAGREKSGEFIGAYVLHPLTGKEVPIWVTDYVLAGYGTGAVMGVPGHDQRDFDFATAHQLPIVQVVAGPDAKEGQSLKQAFEEDGVAVNSEKYNGLPSAEFKSTIIADLERAGVGKRRLEYKLRDWVFSRQRYWGEPIPIYFPVETQGDPRSGAAHVIRYDQPIAVDEQELPLRLPDLEDFKPSNDPLGPLARVKDWRFFQKDGCWFARETNTMPQWAGSCWYYLRFLDPKNENEPWSKATADRFLPVDLYIGGAEHAVLHLLYARFWHKVLYDEGLVSCKEPFAKLVHQGTILGEMEYTKFVNADGQAVRRAEVDVDALVDTLGRTVRVEKVTESEVEKRGTDFVLKSQPTIVLDARAHKMSKSRGNVVNPDEIVHAYGADAMRLYEMFLGPLEATKPWSTHGIVGVCRFLERACLIVSRPITDAAPDKKLIRLTHQAIAKVSEDIEALRFNTAISTLMVFSNELATHGQVPRFSVETLVLLLAPLAPHLGEELWERLGHTPSIQAVPWPTFDPALCVEDEVEIPVQINGKVRARIQTSVGMSETEVLTLAQNHEAVIPYLTGKTLKQTRYVPQKILTLVVG